MLRSSVSPRTTHAIARRVRVVTAGLLLFLAIVPACSSDDSLPLVPATRLCEPGLTRQCVGDAACAGGQVCASDGASWGPCRCGSSGAGAEPAGSGGSGGGKGGAGGNVSSGGKGGASGTKGGAAGSTAGGADAGEGGMDAGGSGDGGTSSGGSAGDGGEGGAVVGGGGTSAGGSNSGGSNSGGSSSGGSNTGGSNTGGSSSGGSNAGGSNSGGSSSGGSSAGGSSSGGSSAGGTSAGQSGSGGGTCVGTPLTPVSLPTDLLLMLDKSSSMDVPVSGGSGTRWQLSVAGLDTFIDSVQPADRTGMGLNLFPSTSCDPAVFAVPVVPAADLPGNAASLHSALATTKPNGGDTPTKPALEGAIALAKQRLVDFPARAVVVVLVTDGEPNECVSGFPTFPPKDVISEVVQVAKAGADAGIATYVVGVFSDSSGGTAMSAVGKWATAGGTKPGFVLSSAASLSTEMAAAFGKIRQSAALCAFEVPAAVSADPAGMRLARTGGPPLPRVDGLAACQTGGGFWYFDDAVAPTKIALCPAACASVRQTPAETLEIRTGCTP